jgi:mannose-6-phosphate isomerase-like protein (cupin superfamily)
MIACRTASIVAFASLYTAGTIAACREPIAPEVPPVTVAYPTALTDAAAARLLPDQPEALGKPEVSFLDEVPPKSPSPWRVEAPVCSQLALVVARGTAKVGEEALATGDIYLARHPMAVDVKGTGSVVRIVQEFTCDVLSRPAEAKTIVRAKDVPEVKWASGTMRAHLDVGTKLSPELYIGRLEGTAAVAEHEHATSSETLIAIEAAGTFSLDGKESRLGPKQIVFVPKGTKHAWKPDPGSKLSAIQLYAPPGPEQRFLTLAAQSDGGATDGSVGAKPRPPRPNCELPFSYDDAGHRHYKPECL